MKTRYIFVSLLVVLLVPPLGSLYAPISVVGQSRETVPQKRSWEVVRVGARSMKNRAVAKARAEAEGREWYDPDWTIQDQLPTNLPLAIEVMNLNTASLLRDIVVKVTNKADKPIYFLQLQIVLPDNLSQYGDPLAFPLPYGRPELIRVESPIEPSDKPVHSGESVLVRIPEPYLKGFEGLVARGITPAEIRKVYLMFGRLNFGNQSGFSSDGSPEPPIRRRDL
ncbi:MAG: hypothetical protein QOJ88_24 [Pyrinomonadaceae bacterium]|nr:hypothetical protein [Pyrinomonadaceae bacterium]